MQWSLRRKHLPCKPTYRWHNHLKQSPETKNYQPPLQTTPAPVRGDSTSAVEVEEQRDADKDVYKALALWVTNPQEKYEPIPTVVAYPTPSSSSTPSQLRAIYPGCRRHLSMRSRRAPLQMTSKRLRVRTTQRQSQVVDRRPVSTLRYWTIFLR